MRRETYCEDCGPTEFLVVETYAAVDALEEIEAVVWACTRCRRRTELAEPVASELVEATSAARRVA